MAAETQNRSERDRTAAESPVMFAFVAGCVFILIGVGGRASAPPATGAAFPATTQIDESTFDDATANALVVLDGATKISREGGYGGSYQVGYEIVEKHPAADAIQQISARLHALGWKPLRDDWLNPGIPSSHVRGWTDYQDASVKPSRHIHLWLAQWKHAAGNVVVYSLRYSYPWDGKPNLRSLRVSGSWYPAATVRSMQRHTRRGSRR